MKYTLFILAFIFLAGACQNQPGSEENSQIPGLEEKIGQMLLFGFRGMAIEEDGKVARQISEGKIGGIVLFDYDVRNKVFDRNIQSPEQLKALISQLNVYAKTPLFISIDQEGGRVLRLKPKYGFPHVPSAQYLGELNNLDSTRHYAAVNAQNMVSLGINLNFAPVVDLNIERDSGAIGVYERSFSEDPDIVIRHAQKTIEAHQEKGVIPVLKHFPGHGSAKGDSHKGMTDVTETWNEAELIPYEELLKDPGTLAVMTAHVFNQNIDPDYPATLSTKAIGILRDRFNYDGVIFSDDMQMEAISNEYGLEQAIVLCINAGVDVLVFGNNLGYDEDLPDKFQKIVLEAIRKGDISEERIDVSFKRIMELKRGK